MDIRLIFRNLRTVRRSDGGNKYKHLIGLVFFYSKEGYIGKSVYHILARVEEIS